MRLFRCLPLVVLALLYSVACSAGENSPEPMLSLQGFSGLLNTPNARVVEAGTLSILYSDQLDAVWNKGRSKQQDNYLFTVGLFSFLEIGGRVTDAPDLMPDLSASIKVTSAPLTRDHEYWPVVAAGLQDIGGGSNLLQSRYIAVSEDLWRFRLSAGYGFQAGRMKGGFGGVEFRAHDWVTLLGEYDTKDASAGLRLRSPELPWIPARLTFTAKSNLTNSSGLDLAFGLVIPLDMKKSAQVSPARLPQAAQPEQAGSTSGVAPSTAQPVLSAPSAGIPNTQISTDPAAAVEPARLPASRSAQLALIRTRLVDAGFAGVRVGEAGDTVVVVEYENVRYNHNELDAIGVVAGIASSSGLQGVDSLRMVIKRKGLRMLLVSVSLPEMKAWLSDAPNARVPAITVEKDTSQAETARFIEGDSASNPDWLKPSLILFPGLKSFVATEVGVFDYLLSVKPDLQVTTWKGGVLNARWDLPVAWSSNFDDHQAFAYARNKAQMDRLMLLQGLNLAPGLLANLGGGMIQHDVYGTLNEMTWSPGSGTNRFRLAQAYAKNSKTHDTTNVWLGSYRMYLAPFDLFLEGTVGRFWGQDTGALLSLKRFFGDTAVDLYYKNTETIEKKHWQAAGISLSFPLTPRRDMKRDPVQLRGADEWSYGVETILAINGQKSNDTVSASLGINPLPSADIYRSYLNRDRLNEDYIQTHRQRLKDAWVIFQHDLSNAWPKF